MERSDFAEFFELLWGVRPRAWQERLLDAVLEEGRWPTSITAPTGSGKSAVVDVHVFANALNASGAGPRVPRRMVVCVNRRAIVDQHEVRARAIAERLAAASEGLLADVARALQTLVTRRDGADAHQPLTVISLRGGVPVDREWIHDPSACTVLPATPDMWGSRVLFSGYGSRRLARPREAGLLAMDAVMVSDEAHLNRQLAVTAGDLERLAASSSSRIGVPGFQFVLTTATPAGADRSAVGVIDGDLDDDVSLRDLLTRPKPVEYIQTPQQPVKRVTDGYIKTLVEASERLREQAPEAEGASRTIGVVVNRVDTAQRVAVELARRHGHDAVVCWVGRMRPMDLDALRASRPGLFTVKGDDSVAFCVATQTVEVGVDLDWAGMVTELAPGPSIAQRAGRVNRRGLRQRAEVVIVGPSEPDIRDVLPYRAADLDAAYHWVHRLAAEPAGIAPWALTKQHLRPPLPGLQRAALSHLELSDAEMLSETSKVPFEEVELAFWLRDSLEDDDDPVSVVMRKGLPSDDSQAIALLTMTPPVAAEMFSASMTVGRSTVEAALSGEFARAFLVTDDAVAPLSDMRDLRPGSVVVIDAQPLTTAGVLSPIDPLDSEAPGCLWEPVSEDIPDTGTALVVRGVSDDDLLNAFIGVTPDEVTEVAEQVAGRPVVPTLGPGDEDGDPLWVVLQPREDVADDPRARQEWSPAQAVPLETHSAAVAARAERVAAVVGLSDELVEAVRAAGQLHDEGKRDRRFQWHTLANKTDVILAKSGELTTQEYKMRQRASDLPSGWRHEQVSAAVTWATYAGSARALVTWLAGTSHGHGRPFFPHAADELVPPPGRDSRLYSEAVREAARELFETHAGWSDVHAQLRDRFGIWGLAYLEAVLRSADCMASKEGS